MPISIEDLVKEVEELKKRVEYLESQILTREDILVIEDFLRRKEKEELELLSIDEAMKELGIDESEIREEISKDAEKD